MKLDGLSSPLAPGTRVVLRTDIAGQQRGAPARVISCVLKKVILETPSGQRLEVARDQVEVPGPNARKPRALDPARDEVILEVLVGSRAWNLATPSSDDDVRGVYLAAFDDAVGLRALPRELRGAGDTAYWELEKTLQQGLRADPNTLEMLYAPEVKVETALGRELREMRDAFTSQAIVGSFGRYAIGQLRRVERALNRRETLVALIDAVDRGKVHDHQSARSLVGADALERVGRSLRDRGFINNQSGDEVIRAVRGDREPLFAALGEHRPKNAYNLVRLLHSCLSWMTTGAPLIATHGAIRDELMRIKEQKVPIEDTLARARELWSTIESTPSVLPPSPDEARANAFLVRARRPRAPRVSFAVNALEPLSADDARDYLMHAAPELDVVHLALTGAHAYGFPSPDSDFDLKGIHCAPPEALLAREPSLAPVEVIEDFRGREFDLSSHELGQAVSLLLKGNGNMIERLLGRLHVVETPRGAALQSLAKGSLSKRAFHHYRGFFAGMRREVNAADEVLVKRALYAYRVALTGVHLLTSGEVETDVRVLADDYGFARVHELVALKARAEKTRAPLDKDELNLELDELEVRLSEAHANSPLPDGPPNAAELEAFVLDVRRAICAGR